MNPQNSQQAMQQLQGYQQSAQTPENILATQQQKLGVPAAQQQVTGLRQAITNTTNLLNQIPGSVYGRTAGSLVTSGQAARQIQGEQAPVSQQLQGYGQQYAGANADLNTVMGQAHDAAGAQVLGQQQQLQNYQNVYDALYKREQDAAQLELQKQQLAQQASAAKNNALSLQSMFGGGATSVAPTTTQPQYSPTEQQDAIYLGNLQKQYLDAGNTGSYQEILQGLKNSTGAIGKRRYALAKAMGLYDANNNPLLTKAR